MKVIDDFFHGFGAYGQALDILFSRKFWWFLLFPFVFMFLMFFGGDWLASHMSDSLIGSMGSGLSEYKTDYPFLEYLESIGGFLIRILIKILYFLFFMSFAGYIILIIMSPVFSLLASRVAVHLTGEKMPFSASQFVSDIFRGIWIALRNMMLQFLVLALLFFLSFIPVLGLFTPIIIFFVNAYFYGFAFVDYAIENKRLNVRQSVKYVNRNAAVIMGVGALFVLALMIPYVRLFICSFVSLWSVVAGTVAVYAITDKK